MKKQKEVKVATDEEVALYAAYVELMKQAGLEATVGLPEWLANYRAHKEGEKS